MYHLGTLSIFGQLLFPYIRMSAIAISPFIEDGSVRLRWRVSYLNWLSIFNYKNFNAEYREKHVSHIFDKFVMRNIFRLNGLMEQQFFMPMVKDWYTK